MTEPRFNPQQFKERQQRDWDTVSGGWEKWWETLESGAGHVSRRLLELAEVDPGQRVLDIATGIGEPALSAARRVGPGGRVVAVDQAAGMLAIARRRATAAGLENVDFLSADGELLNGIEPGFDAVLCRWGLMFFPDVPATLGRIHTLLKPGGRLAAAVWSTAERVPSISLSMRVVREQLQAPPPPPDMPGPFSLADPAGLERALQAAGFRDVRFERLQVAFRLPTAEAYTAFTRDVSAPLVALVAEQPPERQAEIWDAVTEAARGYEVPGGGIQMENECLCVAASA